MKTQNIYTEIDACRLCLSKNLHPILDLDNQPPANSLRKDLSEPVPEAPLALLWCDDCSIIQLTATVDPASLFSQYVWVTATSATARSYSEIYCDEVLKRTAVESPFVVEIASNDGTFLKQFKSKGCPVLGVDPAQNIAVDATNAGIPTWAEFFDLTIAKKILAEKQQPNIVMARNVIPHVKEIHSIVEGLSALIDDTGMVVIEFHYSKAIAEELHYDSIYHEHLFYFSIKSLCALCAQYGLFPFDVLESPISGGSLVAYFSKTPRKATAALTEKFAWEENRGLASLATWREFATRSQEHRLQLKALVETEIKDGKKLKAVQIGGPSGVIGRTQAQ